MSNRCRWGVHSAAFASLSQSNTSLELFFISRGWSGDVSAECRSRRNKDRAVSQYSWLRKPAVQHVLCCRVIHSLPA